jgi:hypothetical protein
MKTSAFILIVITSCFISGCGSDSSSSNNTESLDTEIDVNMAGASQKGPFLDGSSISVIILDSEMSPTGDIYQFNTFDNLGRFQFAKRINGKYAEIAVEGYYFDEIYGLTSSGPIKLLAIVPLSSSMDVSVNVLTHIQAPSIKKLVLEGLSYNDAESKSRQNVLKSLKLENIFPEKNFSEVKFTDNDTSSSALIAISTLFLGFGFDSFSAAGDIQKGLAQVASDISKNGQLVSAALIEKLNSILWDPFFRVYSVPGNISNLYTDWGELPVNINTEELLGFFDFDGDGVIGHEDDQDFIDIPRKGLVLANSNLESSGMSSGNFGDGSTLIQQIAIPITIGQTIEAKYFGVSAYIGSSSEFKQQSQWHSDSPVSIKLIERTGGVYPADSGSIIADTKAFKTFNTIPAAIMADNTRPWVNQDGSLSVQIFGLTVARLNETAMTINSGDYWILITHNDGSLRAEAKPADTGWCVYPNFTSTNPLPTGTNYAFTYDNSTWNMPDCPSGNYESPVWAFGL